MGVGELHTILEMAEAVPGRRFFHTRASSCAGWADGIPGAGLYFLDDVNPDVDGHIMDPVPCRAPYLKGWTYKEPAPEAEAIGVCDYVRALELTRQGYAVEVRDTEPRLSEWVPVKNLVGTDCLFWVDGTVIPIDAHMRFRVRPADTPKPETEDVPIEEFRRLARQARWSGERQELVFTARIVCYLYPNDVGELEEFGADRAWRGHHRDFPHRPALCMKRLDGNWTGDWTQPTKVRLEKPQ